MKESFLNRSISIVKEKYDYDEEKLEAIRYGLEGIYLTFTKMIIIFLLAMILDIFEEMLIFLILYNIIRTFSFGLHAKSSLVCLIFSSIVFLGVPYLSKYIFINKLLKVFLFIITTVLIFIFSPADTEKRPIISKKRRLIYRITSTFICICYMMIGLIAPINFLSNLLLFSLIIQTIIINPISYKIFGVSYNNYKKYIN